MNHVRFVCLIRVLVGLCAFSLASFAQTADSHMKEGPHGSTQGRVQSGVASQASIPTPFIKMATAIGDDYFDGRDSRERVRRHLKIAHDAGVQYLRFGFSWNGVEPEQGHYQFEFWDMLVEEAGHAGIELIPYVAYTPEWAARTKQEFWKQPPKDPVLFASIMRTLAARYRGKIRTWELWNEPDNLEYWTGTADEFAATVIVAAQAVREAAPESRLVLGGMTQGAGEFFQKLVHDHHIERYVDVLAMHAYPESWHEQRAEAVFQQILPQMEKTAEKSGRALWLNEMGYADYRFAPNKASLYGTSAYYKYEHTARYAADFLFKSYTMALASGEVSLAGWYRIDDFPETDPRMPSDKVHDHLGVTDVSGGPKPAFYALRFFNTLFAMPARVVCGAQGPVPCELRHADAATKSDVAPAARRLSRGQPALARDRAQSSNAAPATQSTPSASQAIVNLFQRSDSTVVVTAWLRSSTYNEVTRHTGLEQDRRRERVDIQLPCTAQKIRTFDAMGKQLSTRDNISNKLRNVTLTGDRVFIADVNCRQNSQRVKAD